MGFPVTPVYPGTELAYQQVTGNVNIVSTAEATGTTIITMPATVFDGTPVMVEFFTAQLICDTGTVGDHATISLFESSTQIGRLCRADVVSTAQATQQPVTGRLRFTPTAGSHTYTVTAFADSTTGGPAVGAGAGGTSTLVPAFCRITKV
jgi:hypothetical protein